MKINNPIEKSIQQILASIFPSIEGEFQKEWGPNEIENWDSMSHLNLVMSLSETFDISLDFEEVMAIGTIGDIFYILKKKGIL